MKSSGEQFSGKIEQKKPGERYKAYRQYEKLIKQTKEEGIKLGKQAFKTLEEAHAASDRVTNEWRDTFNAISNPGDVIPVRVTGEGVHVPTFSLERLNREGKKGIFLGMSEEASHEALPMFESRVGTIQGVLAIPLHYEETNLYSSSLHFLAMDTPSKSLRMFDPQLGIPCVIADIRSYFVVDCSENVDIEFPATEHEDARHTSIQALAQNGIGKSRFVSQINKVAAALYSEANYDLEDIKAMDRVRWIARQSERLVADGTCSPDVVSNAILSMFGKRRDFEVEGTRLAIGETDMEKEMFPTHSQIRDGSLIDVLMHNHEDHGLTPVLALGDPHGKEDKMDYFLLREVQSIKF